MSTSAANVTDNFIDNLPPPGVDPSSKRKKVQTPYKPRLSTVVKRAMEDCVDDAMEAQMLMEQMLAWLENETAERDALRQRIALLAPLDHRMATLLEEETEISLRIGSLELILARMALVVTRLERRLRRSLECAREGVDAPKRKGRRELESEGGRQQ